MYPWLKPWACPLLQPAGLSEALAFDSKTSQQDHEAACKAGTLPPTSKCTTPYHGESGPYVHDGLGILSPYLHVPRGRGRRDASLWFSPSGHQRLGVVAPCALAESPLAS